MKNFFHAFNAEFSLKPANWLRNWVRISRVGVFPLAIILQSCAAPVTIPKVGSIDPGLLLSSSEDQSFERMAASSELSAPVTPPDRPDPAGLPKIGELTAYGAKVTPDLEAAYAAYMKGDGEAALTLVSNVLQSATKDTFTQYQSRMLRAQAFILLGRFDEAEAETTKAATLEQELFSTNVNTRALRGETRLRAGDHEAAQTIFSRVAVATRVWVFPTSYSGPPTNMAELINLTTAQLRAYAGLAITYQLDNNLEAARPWAERAEAIFADVFGVAEDALYGPYVPHHSDSFLGRGLNLAVLGAIEFALDKDNKSGEAYFRAAHGVLDAGGLSAPKITVDALRAQALLQAGQLDEAATAAGAVAEVAARRGMADLLWRIETLRGEALFQIGQHNEAEDAYRRAQAAKESAIGTLSTDSAKRRFGVGRDQIIERLSQIDIANNDMSALFKDLERSRAQAFVDMLGGQSVATGRQAPLVSKLKKLDQSIRRLRLQLTSPLGAPAKVVEAAARLSSQRDTLLGQLHKIDPDMAATLSVSSRTLEETQAALGADETMIYGLPLSRGPVKFMVITRDDASVRELDTSNRDLRRDVQTLVSQMSKRTDTNTQVALATRIKGALKLASIGTPSALYVVPSGQLHFVPWGALDVSYPISVLPTGGWLKRQPVEIASTSKATVVGDPEFHDQLTQLPGARLEAGQVGTIYKVAPLLGSDATEPALRASVDEGVSVLHIATHAIFDAQNPLNSALMLSGPNGATRLTAAAIFQAPLQARIVVLSACETGAGRAVAGEDFLGLPRSFYIGGATTVVYSLWPVSDEGTQVFMETFHKTLQSDDIGKAWLAGRDRLRKAGFPPSVYGAFVLGGSMKLDKGTRL